MPNTKKQTIYPYMPNTVPGIRKEMMEKVGISDISELFAHLPEEAKFGDKDMPLPPPIVSEHALRKYTADMLKKNVSCDDYISFLGGGVADHFVPAICDELIRMPEWYTSFLGFIATDSGKLQLWWEFQSLIAELTEMELVGWPAQDGTTSAWSSILMAGRMQSDKKEIVIAGNINPMRLETIITVCRPKHDIKIAPLDPETGLVDADSMKELINENTACVYFENPSYLGGIEDRGAEISKYAHDKGALVTVFVNPVSLGILETPKNYGADLICGELQSLGLHLQYGGGMCGFVATKFDEEWMARYPYIIISKYKTDTEGETTYDWSNWDTVSYDTREEAGDITSTNSALWTVAVTAYLTVMGPQGLKEVGEAIIGKANYAKKKLGEIDGITLPTASANTFMEFVVNFDKAGKTVKEINKALIKYGIFGGHDLSEEYPEYGQSALYCVTENITKDNIDDLTDALKEVLK